jgi:cobalt-zinc-cadmium efflux system outer membrane protein
MKLKFALILFAAGLRAESITLDQAVKEALDKNLNLLAEKYNISIADARILQAGLHPNPVVAYGQDYQNVLGTGVTNANSAGPSEWNTRVDFILERGGKRQRRLELAQAQKSVAELQILNTIRQLTLDVDNAFVDALAARDSLALAKDNLQKLQEVATVNEARVKAGDLAEVELRRTQLAALQFDNSVRQAELRLRTSTIRLLLLIGRPPAPDGVDVSGSLRQDRAVLLPERIREEAFAHRPDLLALMRDQARSQADIRLQIAQGKSDFDVGVMYHNQTGYASGHTMGFFFSAPIPVWNRNQGEVERARREETQLETRIRALQAQIANEAQTAYEQYLTSRTLVDRIEQNMLAQALEVRDTTEYSYRRGEASFVEFLDAERALNETVQGYNDARADYARNLYLLEAVSGQEVNP